ncbi:hypothetical protein ACSBL2_24525 [Pedobacter sp. AW31-3R]|uniref:hypothetical protein n=1 Tax=Pedobacter sp. AW31-3R TaxID=3445781 RepID=UPI003FA06B85
MRDKTLLIKKYSKIVSRYNEMYFGLMMRDEEIYKTLEKEFDLKPKTIYGIVLKMSKVAANEN